MLMRQIHRMGNSVASMRQFQTKKQTGTLNFGEARNKGHDDFSLCSHKDMALSE